MAKRVLVLLSGCGYEDGAEIHEATCTLLALDNLGCEIVGTAPDVNQAQVINHLDSSVMSENRNVMIESGRIMRGNVKPLTAVKVENFDALILPGGFGAAINLCNYGKVGRKCEIRNDVKNLIMSFVRAGKPVGAICIAPVVIAKAFDGSGIKATLTIGNSAAVAADIEAMGAIHKNCSVDDIVVDKENKVVTTPAYMLASKIGEVNVGVGKLVKEVIKLT